MFGGRLYQLDEDCAPGSLLTLHATSDSSIRLVLDVAHVILLGVEWHADASCYVVTLLSSNIQKKLFESGKTEKLVPDVVFFTPEAAFRLRAEWQALQPKAS